MYGACAAKICRCLNTDERSVEVVNLISELYWIESDCKIHFLSEDERRKERQQRALPVLDKLWQIIKPIFDATQDAASNLFIKAIRYAVAEWESICCLSLIHI